MDSLACTKMFAIMSIYCMTSLYINYCDRPHLTWIKRDQIRYGKVAFRHHKEALAFLATCADELPLCNRLFLWKRRTES